MRRLLLTAIAVFLGYDAASASGFSVGSFDRHVAAHHVRACGSPVGGVTWVPLRATQHFQRCVIVGRYKVLAATPRSTVAATPQPRATETAFPSATPTALPSTPTPRPTQTPIPAPTATPLPAADPESYELSLLNGVRSSLGIPPLRLNATQSSGTSSCAGSYGHSLVMQQSGGIWHVNPAYPAASFPADVCVFALTAGENVGEAANGSWQTDLSQLNALMMAEPHDATTCATTVNHACNIINPRFTQVGVGIVQASGATWLTTDFLG